VTWKFSEHVVYSSHKVSSLEKCDLYKRGVYRVTNREDVLAICSLDYRNHSGVYQCVAENELGYARATIDLKIKGEIIYKMSTTGYIIFAMG